MSIRLNKNIAKVLDMEIPEEETKQNLVPRIQPHEIVQVENEDLPPMVDIDIKLLEGEKQLEDFIQKGMKMFSELYEELPEISPDKRNRHIEVTTLIMNDTLEAIKHKNELQLKKKKQRMEESKHAGKNTSGIPTNLTQHFYGSREEFMDFLNGSKNTEDTNK